MIIFSRAKAYIFAICATFVILSSIAFGAFTSHTAYARPHTSTSTGTAHTMKMVERIAPKALPTHAEVNTAQAPLIDTDNIVHQSTNNDTSVVPGTKKNDHPASPMHHEPGKLVNGFDGVNSVENFTASGIKLEPPNESLAVGNGFVVNIVNATGKIYNKSGDVLAGPFSNSNFFGEPASAYISDPRTFFDKETNAWFSLVFEADTARHLESHIDLAVNASGDPTTPWILYRIDTTDTRDTKNGRFCPCFSDYTSFGIDGSNIYLSGNEYDFTGVQSFYGAEIFALPKSQLIDNTETVNYALFNHLAIDGNPAYHVQPAITYGSSDAEYFMNSFTYKFFLGGPISIITDKRLGIWAMTNRDVIAAGGVPTLSSTIIDSQPYNFVYRGQAKTPVGHNPHLNENTTGYLDSNNDAMEEVENINGHLLGGLNSTIRTAPTLAGSHIRMAWFDVVPKTGDDGLISTDTAVVNQNYIDSQGEDLLYPHIERTSKGLTAIAFSLTGSTTNPSAAYVIQKRDGSFGPITIAATGQAADYGFTGVKERNGSVRWGDYSAGQIDPDTNSIWFATQYIPSAGNDDTNWGNYIFQIDR